MANKQRGEVTLRLCGTDYTLRPTFEALCELEDRAGGSVLAMIASMEGGQIRLKELTHIIWSGMYGYDAEAAPGVSEVGEFVLQEGLVSVIKQTDGNGENVITQFLVNGILGDEEVVSEPAKKPVKKKAKRGVAKS